MISIFEILIYFSIYIHRFFNICLCICNTCCCCWYVCMKNLKILYFGIIIWTEQKKNTINLKRPPGLEFCALKRFINSERRFKTECMKEFLCILKLVRIQWVQIFYRLKKIDRHRHTHKSHTPYEKHIQQSYKKNYIFSKVCTINTHQKNCILRFAHFIICRGYNQEFT